MKKGFTLIELLAVIVILSVIALIATPLILGVIEESKKKASISSAQGLIEAGDYYAMKHMENTMFKIDFPNEELEVKGSKPTSGTMLINEEGKTSIAVVINNYCIKKTYYESSPVIVEDEDCRINVGDLNEIIGYSEEILNGAKPVLKNEMIPVTISDTGVVTYADITSEWYSYEDKIWANAVILFDNPSKEYKTGDTILESDIKQYYVWIPRYRYQLWNVGSGTLPTDKNYPNGTAHESAINIVFESKEKPASTGSNNGEWLTHPAFTNFNTNGIWVGKFETSYNENSFTNSSVFLSQNPNTSAVTTGTNIIIKPNVRSLTNKNVSTFYTLSREINEELNSHMMTNMEWGATAYLTYSLYGKCTITSCKELYINNVNTGYYPSVSASASFSGQWQYGASITGCGVPNSWTSAVGNQSSCPENYAWNESGIGASTTGNTSGIYDMSGGSSEGVMGILADVNGNPISGKNNRYNSGFNGAYSYPTSDGQSALSKENGINFPADKRYYNIYTANSLTPNDDTWWIYNNGLLGDATKEVVNNKSNSTSGITGLWYADIAQFIRTGYPWFTRGLGYSGSGNAGILGFTGFNGIASNMTTFTFRTTLAY